MMNNVRKLSDGRVVTLIATSGCRPGRTYGLTTMGEPVRVNKRARWAPMNIDGNRHFRKLSREHAHELAVHEPYGGEDRSVSGSDGKRRSDLYAHYDADGHPYVRVWNAYSQAWEEGHSPEELETPRGSSALDGCSPEERDFVRGFLAPRCEVE